MEDWYFFVYFFFRYLWSRDFFFNGKEGGNRMVMDVGKYVGLVVRKQENDQLKIFFCKGRGSVICGE